MAIVTGTSTVTSGNAGAAPTLVINANVLTGDLLILCVTVRDSTTDPTVDDDDSGTHNAWAKFTNRNADTNGAGSIWYKFATSATAGKTITVTAPAGYGSCGATVTPFRGVSLTRPFADTTAVSEANASGNETQAQITVGLANSMVLLALFCTSNDIEDYTSMAATDPASLPLIIYGESTTGSDCSVQLNGALKTTAGVTGAFTWAATNNTGASIALALAPDISPTTALTGTPHDGDTITDTTPTFNFTGTDLNVDEVEYEVQVDTQADFLSTGSPDGVNTYYFDASDNSTPGTPSDPNSVWTDDNNAFNGNTTDYAYASANGSTASNFLLGEGTNAPAGTSAITQVRARIYGMTGLGIASDKATIYTNALGESLGEVSAPTVGAAAGWGAYIILSTPGGGWSWAKIQALEVKIYRAQASNQAYRVEIEVTSTGVPLLSTLSSTDDHANWSGTGDPHPWPSGNEITYTVTPALTASASPGTTYYWRVRAIDPLGSNTWGAWSPGDSTLGYDHFHLQTGSSCALTGTVTNDTETDIVTGGSTIILTLTGDTWIAAGTGPIGSTANTQALIDGIDSAQSEANGWDAVVKVGIATTDVVRTSNTVATITLPAFATYNITATETITATIPAAVLTGAAQIVATPTFTITATGGAVAANGFMTTNTGFWGG